MQAVAVLLLVAAHDALLVLGGFALANKYYGLSPSAGQVSVNQALSVWGNPTHANPFQRAQR